MIKTVIRFVICSIFAVASFQPVSAQDSGMEHNNAELALQNFLLLNVPADSELLSGSYTAENELYRNNHLNYAIELEFFSSWRLVKIILMDPAAGAPGRVLADVRVLFNPLEQSFSMTSVDWINTYRQAFPLPVAELSESDLGKYIEELISLVPLVDRWGFKVRDIKPVDGLTYRFSYEEPDDMNMLGLLIGGLSETVTFGADGTILNFPHMGFDSAKSGWQKKIRVINGDAVKTVLLDQVNQALMRDEEFLSAQSLSGTLEQYVEEFSVTIHVEWHSFYLDLAPLSGEGHDFRFSINRGTGLIDRTSLVVGILEPDPEEN